MNAVGRGTLLAGRYRLDERLTQSETSSLWRGTDTTLDRKVAIRLVAPRTAGEALDAARRAALIDDSRLVRLLDVAQQPSAGPDASQTYVVSEWVDGRSLADLLVDGALPADRVRMMVGEAAEALASAASVGLHHLALDPTSLLLTSDGAVRVHGLAVDAAARGGAQPDGRAAERVDAVGLVALCYAGLTARWPLPTVSHHTPLDTAPMVGPSAVPPADITSGVPNDLNTLCAVTFGAGGDGPASPAELAQQLRPWASAVGPGSNRRLADDLRSAPRRPPSRFPIRLSPADTPHEVDEVDEATAAQPAGPEERPEGPSGRAVDPYAQSGFTPDVPTAAVARAESPPTEGSAPQTAASARAERRSDLVTTGPQAATAAPTRPAERSAERGEPFVKPGGRLRSTGGVVAGDTRPAAADGPADPAGAAPGSERSGRRAGWWPLVAVAALVIVGLVLAGWSLRSGPSTPEGAASPTAASSASPNQAAPPATPPKIATATPFDPQGDNAENNAQADLAIDGDPATAWRSSRYNTAAFGNLKDGLGLVIKLEQPAEVSKVSVTVRGSGGSVEIRTATGATLEGSQVVASGPAGTLEKTLEPPARTDYLIVWFTELPQVSGANRAEVAEVSVA